MNFHRLFDVLPYQQAKYAQGKALSYKKDGKWISYSTAQCIDITAALSLYFLHTGIKKQDPIAIVSGNGSPLWTFVDCAAMQIGAITVPIHPAIPEEEIQWILQDAGVQYVCVAEKEDVGKIKALQSRLPALVEVYWIEDLIQLSNSKEGPYTQTQLQTLKDAIHEDDLATIIYTSGTTDMPKGVMLSHKNIVSNIKAVIALVPINYKHDVLSFLPINHVFERMVTYLYIAVGASVYFSRIFELPVTMREVRPHYFTAVPRIVERFYENIYTAGKKLPLPLKWIQRWAIKVAKQYDESRKLSLFYQIKRMFARLFIFRFWKRAMGGRIKGIVVGAAALDPILGRFFAATGIRIREGYGLTETAPVVSFNRFEPGGVFFGTVGRPLPGVEVRIDDAESEIQVKGPNVMLGYYNNPELTRQAFTEDGWLKTGDAGKFTYKRFLMITDRIKERFKTSSGKFISPEHLERILKKSPYIAHCMAIGYNRPFVSAVIVPDFDAVKQWCDTHNVHWTAPQYMVVNNKVMQLIDEEVEKISANFANHEKIQKTILAHKPWTIESGEYTTTLKLKRKFILNTFEKQVKKIYQL